MRVKVTKSKNAESFYVIKSVRLENGKTTSAVVEKLGTRESIQEMIGVDKDVEQWARNRAAELTEQEKEQKRTVKVEYSPAKRIDAGERRLYDGGYLFLQDILHSLGISSTCKSIEGRYRFEYDLESILTRLVYGRILDPSSKRSTCAFAQGLIEAPGFKEHQVYRSLEVLAKESEFIQSELYKNSQKAFGRKSGVLYYDCTNYFFEIEQEDELRRYGLSKEHRPTPIVQMGLFMDAEGIPLVFCIHPGNASEQITMTPLEQKIIDDFGISKFVTCTDAGLSSLANRRFNVQDSRQFITTQSVKKLKGHLQTWALDTKGWSARGRKGTFDLEQVIASYEGEDTKEAAKAALRNLTFYKSRMVREKDAKSENGYFEQQLIVTFSLKHRDYQQSIRAGQIERAIRAMGSDGSRMERKGANDFRRLCKKTSVTEDGEIAESDVWSIDEARIAKEARFDGFYALCTSFENEDIEMLLKVNARRWEIEECFRIMKTEFKARPVYLSREDRIRAHFLTCFIALLVYRLLEKQLKSEFTCEQIIDTLRDMKFEKVRNEGYRPMYAPNEITNALHDSFGFRTDYEILSTASMRKIIRQTKKMKNSTTK